MELSMLFSSLSEVIFYSIFHGVFVYAFVKLILKAFPELPSSERYKILYVGMIWIFVSFIISFSNAYLTGLENTESSMQMQEFENKAYLAGPFQSKLLLPGFTTWIAVLYFAGLVIQFAMLSIGLFRVNTIRKKSIKEVDFRWNSQLNNLSKILKLEKKVTISIIHNTLIPCTIGFIKPMILFPVAVINSLNPAEVEAILLHELAHIKRNDYLFNLIQRVMEMILFFNPAIWLIGKEIRKEREFCCDDIVLQNTSNPVIYAQALLQIAEYNPSNLSLSLSASGEEKYTLLNRIKRVTNMKTTHSNPKHHLFTTLTVVAVCLSLAWIIPAEQVIKKQKNNNTALIEVKPDTVRLKLPEVANPADAPPIPSRPPFPPIYSIKTRANLTLAPLAPMVPKIPLNPAPSAAPDVPEPIAIPFPSDTTKSKNKFSSLEWKKQIEEMKSHSEEMKKHFESPEWKKHIAEMKVNAKEMKSQALAMQKEFNSPEWKKKLEDMKNHSLEMKKQFDSPDWKKQIEEMKINSEEIRKQFESPEWKRQMEEIKKMSQSLKQEAENSKKKY